MSGRRSTSAQRQRVALGLPPNASAPSMVYSGYGKNASIPPGMRGDVHENMVKQWEREKELQYNVSEREKALSGVPEWAPSAGNPTKPNVFGDEEEEVFGRNVKIPGIFVYGRKQQPSSSSSHMVKTPSNWNMPSPSAMNRTPTPTRRNAFTAFRSSQYSGTKSAISLPSEFAGPSSSYPQSSGIASSASWHARQPRGPFDQTPPPDSPHSSPKITRNPDGSVVLSSEAMAEMEKMNHEKQRMKDMNSYLQWKRDQKEAQSKLNENIADPIARDETEKIAESTIARDETEKIAESNSSSSSSSSTAGLGNEASSGVVSGVPPPIPGEKEAGKQPEDAGSEQSSHGGGEPNNSGSNSGETYSSSSSSSSSGGGGGAPQAGAGAGTGAGAGGEGGDGNGMSGGLPRPAGDVGYKNKPGRTGPPPPPGITPPPPVNENTQGQGDYHPPPYGDGSNFAEKARESDSDRTNPITPATGSKQTPSTANSLVGAGPIMASAEKQSPEKVYGTAEERANMGKGRPSPWEYNGPFDFPSRAGGSLNTSLTAVGAWRSKTGEHASSVWRSQLTARGEPAKRDSFYKWSSKGGGNWRQLNGSDAMHVFSKMDAKRNGARWLSRPNPGQQLTHLMGATLKRKMEDINMGKKGNERMNKRKKGADPAAPGVVQM